MSNYMLCSHTLGKLLERQGCKFLWVTGHAGNSHKQTEREDKEATPPVPADRCHWECMSHTARVSKLSEQVGNLNF